VFFWSREAVVRFLQEINLRPDESITIMDDLRHAGTSRLPRVLLTPSQAAMFQV
jgi:hypothetical protein